MNLDPCPLSTGAVTTELIATQRRLADDLGRNTIGNADAAHLPTCRADRVMSALCLCALHSAGAALILGHILKQVGSFDTAAKRCAASRFGHQLTRLKHEARPNRTASLSRSAHGRPSPRWNHHDHQGDTEGDQS